MPNILDYIQWRGDLSFEKDQLNHVDALIFSRISYLPFENIPDKISDNGIKLSKACKMLTQQENYREKLLWKEDDNLINYSFIPNKLSKSILQRKSCKINVLYKYY